MAQLVLLDNQFSVMPKVVAEGRRVIANIQRVAALFLTKNVSSLLLALCVAVAGWPYSFLPRHVTLVSSLAIGIPGFFLALGPNTRRFESGFVGRVLRFALPAGALTATAGDARLRAGASAGRDAGPGPDGGHHRVPDGLVWVLVVQARPLEGWKVSLVGAMEALSALIFAAPMSQSFFELQLPAVPALALSMVFGAAAASAIELV